MSVVINAIWQTKLFPTKVEAGHYPNQVVFQVNSDINSLKSWPYIPIEYKKGPGRPEEQLCLLDISCPHETKEEIFKTRSDAEGTYDPTTEEHIYQAKMEYECGLGRGFSLIQPGVEPDLKRELTCQEDGNWDTDPDQLDPCICKLNKKVAKIGFST